jgi:putative nucleotidyltransferase with HDIG domain
MMGNSNLEKILFVDDEESILNVASEYFRRKGYRVMTARNGVEAVEILEKEEIDCCFTDINMPQMDGLALAEHINQVDNTLPVVVMTGYPSLENTIKTLKNGVVDFLIKPVNLGQMELCVRRVISQRKLFVENLLLKKEVESKERLEKLNHELAVKVSELNILNKILVDFSASHSTKDVFQRLLEIAIDVTATDLARFYVINDSVQTPLAVATAAMDDQNHHSVVPYPGGNGGAASVMPETWETPIAALVREIATDEIPMLISENHGTRGLPQELASLMMVPLKIRNKVFGVLMAAARDRCSKCGERDLYYLSFMAQNAANVIENLALYENIYENLFSTLYAFVHVIEARDRYTQQHSSRVTRFSILIGKVMGCTSEELDILNFAGHLHDIGKIGIRDEILLKPGRLNDEEFNKIKEHPVIGAQIVEQLGFWERERQIIRWHHERYDGGGYPDGLKRDEIPFLARILSVADVYDAISSDRAYRRKMKEDQILQIIREGAGTQFDPKIVDVFMDLYHRGEFQAADQWDPDLHPFSKLEN